MMKKTDGILPGSEPAVNQQWPSGWGLQRLIKGRYWNCSDLYFPTSLFMCFIWIVLCRLFHNGPSTGQSVLFNAEKTLRLQLSSSLAYIDIMQTVSSEPDHTSQSAAKTITWSHECYSQTTNLRSSSAPTQEQPTYYRFQPDGHYSASHADATKVTSQQICIHDNWANSIRWLKQCNMAKSPKRW